MNDNSEWVTAEIWSGGALSEGSLQAVAEVGASFSSQTDNWHTKIPNRAALVNTWSGSLNSVYFVIKAESDFHIFANIL